MTMPFASHTSNSTGTGTVSAERSENAQRLRAGAQTLGLALDDSQIDQLLDYLALLVKWNAVYNLTAVRDPAQMITQHLLDSLAVVDAFAGADRVLDVGAGGGLPGVVVAIWAKVAHPALRIDLIDTVQKKTAFLTQVKTELGLSNMRVHSGRVEQFSAVQPYDLITSRAFADLADFVSWSQHLLAPDGVFLAMKGVLPEVEMARLPDGWIIREVRPVRVPMLDAERHLVWIGRANDAQPGMPEAQA